MLAEFEGAELGALEALSALKEREIDLPLIIVSDQIGEETAIRALKAGAHNCIQRDALSKIGVAIERELREAQIRRERRLAQKALRESETRFRTLAETASDAILTVDDADLIVFANRAAETIFGHPVSALIGSPSRSAARVPEEIQPGARDGPASPRRALSLRGRKADGTLMPLEVSCGVAFARTGSSSPSSRAT